MATELIFLGTSQAVPTANRNHTAILLRHKDESILVDCGEGTQRQFRIAGLNPCKLTRILITHWHGDHVLGLPGLLQTLALNNYNKNKTLYVYGPHGTKQLFSLIYKLFIFQNKIRVKINEINSGVFLKTEEFSIEAFPLNHSTACLAYRFAESEKRKMDVKKLKRFNLKGKLVGELQKGKTINLNGKTIKPDDVSYIQKGKVISFILDTALNDNCFKVAKGSDLLIIEAPYLNEMKDKALKYKHLTASQAAQLAKKARVKELILTHLSQRYEKEEKKILYEAKSIFTKTILARDFLKINL
jgi:ribonuclease Z